MNEKPNLHEQSEDYQRIAQAIRYLEEHFKEQPSLDEIAAAVHLSKYHFQRLFKRWAGVTPNQFLHYLTVEYAKERLQEADSVFDAALDSGLSGSGRLHDLFVTFEAMTPGQYKEKGAGLTIQYGVHPTPFGLCFLGQTDRGICALRFLESPADAAAVIDELAASWPEAQFSECPDLTRLQVEHIFRPNSADKPVHLHVKGTNFQIQVWQALLTIPQGNVVAYQDLAEAIGSPNSTRAVAGAVGRNPAGYIIPCHRVISKNGDAHGYRWGTTRKKAILAYEAAQLA